MIHTLRSCRPPMLEAAVEHIQAQTGMPAHVRESWGPLVRVQTDFSGEPIQQYLTLLVLVSERFLLVQQIIDLDRISRRQPVIHEINEREARAWICDPEMSISHQAISDGLALTPA